MDIKYIDNIMFKKMVLGAAMNLENNRQTVDSLNVFPVPDGDTGTNMNLTVQSAVKEINLLSESSIQNIADAVSKGSLMGARGNSGVILSQIFRGFAKGLSNEDKITPQLAAKAFGTAAETAYKAVMKPVEGTILTVAKDTASKAKELSFKVTNMVDFLEKVVEAAKLSLDRTPEFLPVLKQAGVVDAGGKGLLCLLEGALATLKGVEIKKEQSTSSKIIATEEEVSEFGSEDEIIYAYCTEFMIKYSKKGHDKFLPLIMDKGDSIVCVGADDIIKVHIHTNNPGVVLSKATTFGELINVKIDNMKEQFRNKKKVSNDKGNVKSLSVADKKKYGFVAIGFGDGIEKAFKDLGVDEFISGGQTMNPSTEDILAAVDKINADNVIIMPNNGNIILAAEQAKKISKRKLFVIPTKTIPQGIAAMLAFNDEVEGKENAKNMTEAIAAVKTGQVTYAVRDTEMNGIEIKKDDVIGILDKDIVTSGKGVEEQTTELIKKMVDDESYIITVFYGEMIKEEEANCLKNKIEEIAENCDVEILRGGQPLYYYIVSVE